MLFLKEDISNETKHHYAIKLYIFPLSKANYPIYQPTDFLQ